MSNMKFPNKKYINLKHYFDDYYNELNLSMSSVNINNLKKVINLLRKIYKSGKNKVFVCGNGGSAALAEHFACDHQKILFETKKFRPSVYSLVSNSAIGTAISNDVKYEAIFSEQLKYQSSKGDILIVISSSGKSKNIVEAVKWANKNKLISISMTGFDGGTVKRISRHNLHVSSKNYGIIEANHQSLMNIISQYLKMKELELRSIKKVNF